MGEIYMTALSGVVAGAARVIPPAPQRDNEEPLVRSHGMDGIRELLSATREAGLAAGNFRGLLHIAIGRRITRSNGAVSTSGVTWRELAAELKYLRFDPELVREFGTDPETLAALTENDSGTRRSRWPGSIRLKPWPMPTGWRIGWPALASRLAPRLPAFHHPSYPGN